MSVMPVSSWGRLSAPLHRCVDLNKFEMLEQIRREKPGLARGMGRSYGDSCLNPEGVLWQTMDLNRLISFDDDTGILRCEAGTLLRDIQQLMVSRGWMLPVTPGTELVTIGGAIANDVHGKNHHAQGSFGDHVRRLQLIRTDGSQISCGPDERSDWFAATLGGLGLTGVISQTEIQLRRVPSSWLETETIPYASLDEFFELSDESETHWEHTVSWIDCLAENAGRGLFMRGNFADIRARPEPVQKEKKMLFVPPISLVNRLTLQPFNALYFHLKRWCAGKAIAHYRSFFYPLDGLHDWNRMYGPRGFFQYQSVIPRKFGSDATAAMLREIRRTGEGSFLAVLKTFGNRQSMGMLSFPQHGVTLALDFPNHGERTLALLKRLDAIVREAKGRIYPAKDARMSRELFVAGYPRLFEFEKYRDPGISSGFSRRVMGY